MPKATKFRPLPGADLASLYANRFHISISGSLSRIVFGESRPGSELFHSALTMQTSDLIKLGGAIQKLVQTATKKQDTAKKQYRH